MLQVSNKPGWWFICIKTGAPVPVRPQTVLLKWDTFSTLYSKDNFFKFKKKKNSKPQENIQILVKYKPTGKITPVLSIGLLLAESNCCIPGSCSLASPSSSHNPPRSQTILKGYLSNRVSIW